MKASVVISYYKNLPNLALILQALNQQAARGYFEVLISEDDDATETVEFLQHWKTIAKFPILHISQRDDGFRKCRALNKAVEAANSDLIIFIDGDCIPHPQFVQQYINNKKPGRVMYGRRAMLSEKISQQLWSTNKLDILNPVNLLATGCKRVEEALFLPFLPQQFKTKHKDRLLGCNMAINKKELLGINGFDEDYIAAGAGEDSDIEWRLEALKDVSFYSMKFQAIVYHIFHPLRFTPAMERLNYDILHHKMQDGFFACKNGLQKLP